MVFYFFFFLTKYSFIYEKTPYTIKNLNHKNMYINTELTTNMPVINYCLLLISSKY